MGLLLYYSGQHTVVRQSLSLAIKEGHFCKGSIQPGVHKRKEHVRKHVVSIIPITNNNGTVRGCFIVYRVWYHGNPFEPKKTGFERWLLW